MTPRLKSASVLLAACLLTTTARGQPYVEDSINVYHSWVGSMCYNSTADAIYGRCQDEAGVFFAISADSNRVVVRWVLSWPRYLCYDSLGNKCYLAYAGENEDSLAVIDGTTHTLIKGLPMPGATTPTWDPTSNRVYVTSQSCNEVVGVDCRTDSVICHIPVGDCPLKLYLNGPGRKLYVINYDDASVSVIDITTNQVIRTLRTGGYPNAGLFSEVLSKFYVAGMNEVVVIGGQCDSVVARIWLTQGGEPTAFAENPRSHLVMVAVSGTERSVYTLDGDADTLLWTVQVGEEPVALLRSPVTGRVYCANGSTDDVSVLNADGTQVQQTLRVGNAPFVLAYSPVRARLYVGHLNSGRVYVIRDSLIGIAESEATPRSGWGRLRATPTVFSHRKPVCVSGASNVQAIAVFSQDGRIVKRLRSYDDGGAAKAIWDGTDGTGREVPPGAYTLVAQGTALAHARVVKLP
jgi:YVTN family beta-propeller protein